MTQPGYDEDGNARFQMKDRDDAVRQAERAARIEAERMRNRWWKGRMFKAAQDLLARFKWL